MVKYLFGYVMMEIADNVEVDKDALETMKENFCEGSVGQHMLGTPRVLDAAGARAYNRLAVVHR